MAKPGPRTEAGKRRSALNALSHGALARTPVIPGIEDEADWDQHLAGFHQSLAPATPFEAFLVERIAQTAWRLRRLELCENEMLNLAQDGAEEQAATRILFPGGGAISLHGASAAALIQDRIDRLRTLAELLLAFNADARTRARLTRDQVELLYEGLNLALSPAYAPDTFQRQVLRDITAQTPAEEAKARNLAATVAALLDEMNTILGEPPGADAQHDSPPAPPPPSIAARYPVDLVLLRLWPETRRLEHERLDLDATIARIRRESLLLESAELAKVTRYEAHLRRQFTQNLHELEARQSARGGRSVPLARLDVQLLDRPGIPGA
jgi:hypothetical protein